MTGLAAGLASGYKIFEKESYPGGICSSYYRDIQSNRYKKSNRRSDLYRFEIGGGHWLHSSNKLINRFLSNFCTLKEYNRESGVYLPEQNLTIPYPIQHNLRFLDEDERIACLVDLVDSRTQSTNVTTMEEWFRENFGEELVDIFFEPFHELYTAGLWDTVGAPPGDKSPNDIEKCIRGAFSNTQESGYNVQFSYPKEGLDTLARRMASEVKIEYNREVRQINTGKKKLVFKDGKEINYDSIISTLPLNKIADMADISTNSRRNPYVSVMVVNIGAIKGNQCPDQHWLYLPESDGDFHRIGFYSNVDSSFVPDESSERVSIYAEKAFEGGNRPSGKEISELSDSIVKQLQDWDWIQDTEVVDPTWIDVAYTWEWPESNWAEDVSDALAKKDIYTAGRYATWASGHQTQGIVGSLKQGLEVGQTHKHGYHK